MITTVNESIMQVIYALNWKIFVLLLCEIPYQYQPVKNYRSNTDMVDSCQEKKSLPSNCFPAVLVVDRFQGTQGGGTCVTTVDHSDIRGLVTA